MCIQLAVINTSSVITRFWFRQGFFLGPELSVHVSMGQNLVLDEVEITRFLIRRGTLPAALR